MSGYQANQTIKKQRKLDVIFGYITKVALMVVINRQKIIMKYSSLR